jgi:bacterioferritin
MPKKELKMERGQILSKLNWFYNLELNQVDLYMSQSGSFKDTYVSSAFERIAYIEQQHVDNIAEKIKEMGGTPSKVGDVIFPIVGSIAGKVVSLGGLERVLKANILIENKAMQDYRTMIASLKESSYDEELMKILEHNLVDEDLHTAWFKTRLEEMGDFSS